ncbi:hypothetical protein [Nocardia vulneris]|uniref:HTH merR-type domain-containing protein n=1 Tax=Nocardia vulneris TaxID=1141657 RepID=A0ABR4ZCD4_9NOCA|nr:hypothetical protein [Nocardia vulneris]KIA63012.1 hypothetical protein FG87_21845 [Nocardia vulneris]
MTAILATDGLDQKLSAVEASAIFGVQAATIRKWASLGKIQAVGEDRQHRKLYRLIDLARYEKETRRAAGRS